MATMDDYFSLAEAVHIRNINTGHIQNGFNVVNVRLTSTGSSGFQGVVFENNDEVVIALAGTMGGLMTAPISQISANVRIGLGIIPNIAGDAFDLAREAATSTAKPISLVGHSLGGALAQVVGTWASIPFISLNGPGMGSHLKASRFNIAHPRQMARTVSAMSRSASGSVSGRSVHWGICFVTANDLVGNFGSHVGHVVRLPAAQANNHQISAIRSGLGDQVQQSPDYWIVGWRYAGLARQLAG